MNTRGFTRTELLIVLVVLVALIVPIFAYLKPAHRLNIQARDSTQLKQIHTGWLTAAADTGGVFPLPGAINRGPDPTSDNQQVPGRGPIDESRNEHASLHAACIAQHLVSTQILISPMEKSSRVMVCANYNFNAYSPAQDRYWDESAFTCDLGVKCNTSYAVMPLDKSNRRKSDWRISSTSTLVVLGNRGNKGGTDPTWTGNVCFNDSHVDFLSSPTLTNGTRPPDNLFRNDTIGLRSDNPLHCSDSFLVIQKYAAAAGVPITEDSPEVTWD